MIKIIETIQKGNTTYIIQHNELDKEYYLHAREKGGFKHLIKESKKLSTIKKYLPL